MHITKVVQVVKRNRAEIIGNLIKWPEREEPRKTTHGIMAVKTSILAQIYTNTGRLSLDDILRERLAK